MIDTSSEYARQELLEDLKELNIKPEQINIILITHYHWDHKENLKLFPNAKIYDYNNLKDKKEIPNLPEIKILKTPGHTEDSLCFLYQDILFSGDTLFHRGFGRTDLQGGSIEKMMQSLEKLKKIQYKTLCPGHVSRKDFAE